MTVATATILSAGRPMPSSYRLVSVDVHLEVNRIPSAEIRLLDGNVLNQYEVSDGAHFEPGGKIEIKLRHEGERDISVFQGLVVKQTLEWTSEGALLTVRVKDVLVKLAAKRQSMVHERKTDDDIIKDLLYRAGFLAGRIAATKVQHPVMMQYDCTAWDFICMRAEASGMLVTVEAGVLSMQPMDATSNTTHSFTWGTNMYEFEVEAAAEHPYERVQGVAWDPTRNAMTDPPINASTSAKIPGNLDPKGLAKAIGRDTCLLKHPVPAVGGEVQAWVNGRLSRSVLATLRGRISIRGDGKIKLLDNVKIAGVGRRFEGSALVTAVRHRYSSAGWRTDVQLGLDPMRFSERNDIAEVPALGLLPSVRGLQIGVVVGFDGSPQGELRVKVVLPGMDASSTVWARLAGPDAGAEHGFHLPPEEGDEVIVGFLFDDPRHPVVLGAMYGSKNAVPAEFKGSNETNLERGFTTKKGTTLKFIDGEKPAIIVKTKGGNSIVIDEGAQGIRLEDQHGHTIVMNAKGITIDAGSGNVTIKGSKVDVQ